MAAEDVKRMTPSTLKFQDQHKNRRHQSCSRGHRKKHCPIAVQQCSIRRSDAAMSTSINQTVAFKIHAVNKLGLLERQLYLIPSTVLGAPEGVAFACISQLTSSWVVGPRDLDQQYFPPAKLSKIMIEALNRRKEPEFLQNTSAQRIA